MQQQPSEYFLSYFTDTNIFGVLIAILFGVIWLACYRPQLLKRLWLLEILAGSAIITLLAVSFIQVPIQNVLSKSVIQLLAEGNIVRGLLLNGIPLVIITGLIQEGAKLIPPVIYWLLNKRKVDTRLMIIVGAFAGAGFGIFEAQWIHNFYIASGWSWSMVHDEGLITIIPFVERFFAVAFHIGACALTCYGLAKGFGWLSYLVISIVHAIMKYSSYLALTGCLTLTLTEIYVAILAVLVMAGALWLRWKKQQPKEKQTKERHTRTSRT